MRGNHLWRAEQHRPLTSHQKRLVTLNIIGGAALLLVTGLIGAVGVVMFSGGF
jgi:hypothetical protein